LGAAANEDELLLSVVESDLLLDHVEPLLEIEILGKTLGFHIYWAVLELVRLVVVVRGAHNMLRKGQNSFERQSRLAAKARESLVAMYKVLLHVFSLGEGSLTAQMVHQGALNPAG